MQVSFSLSAGKATLGEYLDHRSFRVPHDLYCSNYLKSVHVVFGLEIGPAVNEDEHLMHR
jgi:hypothetical protein